MSFWLWLNEILKEICSGYKAPFNLIWSDRVLHMPVGLSNCICRRMKSATGPICVNLNGIVRLYRLKVLFKQNNAAECHSLSSLYGHVTTNMNGHEECEKIKPKYAFKRSKAESSETFACAEWKCVRYMDVILISEHWTHLRCWHLCFFEAVFCISCRMMTAHKFVSILVSSDSVSCMCCWRNLGTQNNFSFQLIAFAVATLESDDPRSAESLLLTAIKMRYKFPFMTLVHFEASN